MGTERRRKKKKRLNWPAVLALVLLVSGTGLLVACKLEPGLLEVFQPMGRGEFFRIAFRGGFAGTGWGGDPEKPSPDDPAGGRDRLGEGRCRF